MPMVRNNEPISVWEDGDFVSGFALVTRKDGRKDRNDRLYFALELSDVNDRIEGRIFPDNAAFGSKFDENDFIAFKGIVKEHRGRCQVQIDYCRRTRESDRADGFDEQALIPSTRQNPADLWARFEAIFPAAIQTPELREIATNAVERYGSELSKHPAAKRIHHAYVGGLLEHTVSMAEIARSLSVHYPEVDLDLVLVGVLFHDLGKLTELSPLPKTEYTLEGQLVGHIVKGRDLLRECCAKVDGLKAETVLQLEHLVLSHHGRREFGSPVEPSTAEAILLSQIDRLDSTLAQVREFRADRGPGVHFHETLGRSLYFPSGN